jgi:hypothetical protein
MGQVWGEERVSNFISEAAHCQEGTLLGFH